MQYGNAVRCALFFLALVPGVATATDDDAAFVSFFGSVPKTMTAGEIRTVTILMRNAGDSTWTRAEGFELGSEDPSDNTTWGLSRVEIDDAVAVEPEAAYTFSFAITAPSTAGEHAFQWQMVHDGTRFGGKTPSKTIPVTPPPNDAAFASYRGLPASMTAGETASVGVTMQNTGTASWTGTAGYKLVSRNAPSDLWGVSQATLPDGVSIPPKAYRSFALTITAPATVGDHAFQWQMEQNGTAFGAITTSQTITVTPVNTAPVVALAIDDLTLTVGGRSETVDLSLHFSDPEQDEMSYSASSADPAVVTAALANGLLTLTAAAAGTADVTVTATDASGLASDPDVFTVTAASPVDVTIPDANLRAAVEQALGKQGGETITSAEMERMTYLYCGARDIKDLTGLEFATGLDELELAVNAITDVTPLSGLTNLMWLYLYDNAITDATALARLTKLTWLSLDENALTDVTPLAGLTKLTWLSLYDNAITDVTPLAGLTKLDELLDLGRNAIRDVTPLAGLTKLRELLLDDNAITDPSPLSSLTQLTYLELGGNPIRDVTPLAGLTQLEDLGLGSNAITDVTPLAGLTELARLYLSDNDITDVSPLSGLTSLTGLSLGNNKITDVTPLAGLTQIRGLRLGSNKITDVTPLTGLTQIKGLDLGSNGITDLTPVSGLTELSWWLYLDNNKITDVTPLAGLTKLGRLDLSTNDITVVSPLSGLTELYGLYLGSNGITDVSSLSLLTKLTSLDLGSNEITHLNPLSGLTELKKLELDSNCLTSIGGLTSNAGLGDGDHVSLQWNPLDPQALANDVTALRDRGVTVLVSKTPSVVLGAPLSLSATPGDGELALTWGAPSGPIKPVAYELRWRSATGTFSDWAVVPCSSKRRHRLTGLTNGTTYTVELRAAGNAGNGVATTSATPASP